MADQAHPQMGQLPSIFSRVVLGTAVNSDNLHGDAPLPKGRPERSAEVRSAVFGGDDDSDIGEHRGNSRVVTDHRWQRAASPIWGGFFVPFSGSAAGRTLGKAGVSGDPLRLEEIAQCTNPSGWQWWARATGVRT